MKNQTTPQLHGTTRTVLLRATALLLSLAALASAAMLLISFYMKAKTNDRVLSYEEALSTDVDCILVLGAGLRGDGTPSTILADRLDLALALYLGGASPRLLMSGDHSRTDYNEVAAMKAYVLARGADSSEVFMDHAGFSTYESLYRARDVFAAKRILIVTQGYHLTRALYVAEALGLEAYGVASDARTYSRQLYYSARELVARCKDYLYCIFLPLPTYLGHVIPVSGNGNETNRMGVYPLV